jgi:hypothetical protein
MSLLSDELNDFWGLVGLEWKQTTIICHICRGCIQSGESDCKGRSCKRVPRVEKKFFENRTIFLKVSFIKSCWIKELRSQMQPWFLRPAWRMSESTHLCKGVKYSCIDLRGDCSERIGNSRINEIRIPNKDFNNSRQPSSVCREKSAK